MKVPVGSKLTIWDDTLCVFFRDEDGECHMFEFCYLDPDEKMGAGRWAYLTAASSKARHRVLLPMPNKLSNPRIFKRTVDDMNQWLISKWTIRFACDPSDDVYPWGAEALLFRFEEEEDAIRFKLKYG